VAACCSKVCNPYKKAVSEKYNMIIETSHLSLNEAEYAVFKFGVIEEHKKPVRVCQDEFGIIYINLSIDYEIPTPVKYIDANLKVTITQ